jgi:AraC-like DNA-binding protein
MAAQVGMSRAVFHRKFKQATTMSPLQFVKSMCSGLMISDTI